MHQSVIIPLIRSSEAEAAASTQRPSIDGALELVLGRRQLDGSIEAEIQICRAAVHEAKALATGNYRDRHSVLSVAEGIGECIALASIPLDQRPKPISTGIPSLDLDRRGGVIPGKGEGTWVLACSGKFAIAGPLRTHGTGSATPSYGKTPTATGR
jgi:hypothetical protein